MKKTKNLRKRVFSLFLALVMCAGLLQTPAFAAEEEHEHNSAGWTCEKTPICTQEEHTHDEACTSGEPPCGLEEHWHTEDCWRWDCAEPQWNESPVQEEESVQEELSESPDVHADVGEMTPKEKVDRIIDLMKEVPKQITKENIDVYGPILEECDQIMGGEYCENFGDAEWDYAEGEAFYEFYDAFDRFAIAFISYQELLAELENGGEPLIESRDAGIQLTYEDGVLTVSGEGWFTGLLINKVSYASMNRYNCEWPDTAIREIVIEGESIENPIEIGSALFKNAGLMKLTASKILADSFAFYEAFAEGASIDLSDSTVCASVFAGCKGLDTVTLDHVIFSDANNRFHLFSRSSIQRLVIRNMDRIGAYAFSGCTINGEVDLTGVSYIGEHAFSGTGSPVLKNLSEDAVVAFSDVFASQVDGWSGRVANILRGKFKLDPPKTAESIAPQGWTSSKTGTENSTEGKTSTQITQEARWSNSERTEADVLIQTYLADVQQMDFVFVMDLSNSMSSSGGGRYSRFYEMQSKLLDVSRELLAAGDEYDCQVAFVTFGGDSDPWHPVPWEEPVITEGSLDFQDFTDRVDEAAEFITRAEVYDEYTDYGLGLNKALELAENNQEKGRHTAVIFISDGSPNKGDGKTAAERLKAAGVPIFGVLQSVPEKEEEMAEAAMRNICTTGLFFKGNDTEGFSRAVNDAVQNALKTCILTVDVNSSFALNADSITASAGSADVSEDGTTITWTIAGRAFEKHTLGYRLKLNSENGTDPVGTFDTNAGSAYLLVSGLAVNEVESPALTRTQPVRAHTLTVRYQYSNGVQAAAAVGQTVAEGASYSVTSPAISGFRASAAVVSGTMGTEDLLFTVTYTAVGGGGGGGGTGGGGGGGTTGGTGGTTINDAEVPLAGDLQLNREDHFAYIKGYQDGTVRPNNPLTRAQVATIFYRLLDEMSRTIYFQETNGFTDVKDDFWACKAISTLTNAGIITGFQDGTFRPNAYITRAQFAAIAARFDNVVPGLENPFTDVAEDYWARDLIAYAADKGWINGSNGKFRPLENITRLEAMDFINNVLDRHVDEKGILDGITTFTDVPVTNPSYYVVEEATNSHDYTRRTEGQLMENWTKLNPDPVWDE